MKEKLLSFVKLVVAFLIFYYSSTGLILILNYIGIDIAKLNLMQKSLIELGLSIFLMIVTCLIYFKELRKDFKEFKYNWKSKVVFSLKIFIIFMLIKFGASYISSFLALTFGIELTTSENQESINTLLKQIPLIIAFTSVVLAPIYEEVLFRLGFKKCIKNKILFVIISGFVFGFIHIFPTDLSLKLAIFQVIPYVTMGMCLAYYYQKYNNIFYSILLHFYNNFFSIIVLLMTMLFENIIG